MRIPWIPTFDALIEELNRHLDDPVTDPRNEPMKLPVLGLIRDEEHPGPAVDWMDNLKEAVRLLFCARELAEFPGTLMRMTADGYANRFETMGTLAEMDKHRIQYPEMEGREGLARLVEEGGLFGPVLGRHIASAIRGDAAFRSGPKGNFEQGRIRRWTVKQVATVQHHYAVGRRKAVEMVCAHYFADDPEETAIERVDRQVKSDRNAAKRQLENPNLTAAERRNMDTVLGGQHADLPPGTLRGKPYPQALKDLRKPA